ncbi:MAG: hypothetical protein EOO34_00245 [Cyanobacteriota bacterium]|nr:MAG: hypothetical protein EOO34_00245 [Cyanobacteriota bacterium]
MYCAKQEGSQEEVLTNILWLTNTPNIPLVNKSLTNLRQIFDLLSICLDLSVRGVCELGVGTKQEMLI